MTTREAIASKNTRKVWKLFLLSISLIRLYSLAIGLILRKHIFAEQGTHCINYMKCYLQIDASVVGIFIKEN